MEIQRFDSAIEIPQFNDSGERKAGTWASEDSSSTWPISTDAELVDIADAEQSQPQTTSRLLSLPSELLLLILEFVVTEDEPLYVNGPCDSSFGGGWNAEYYADKELWEKGEKKSPPQPGITRVCRDIRAEALPMFYKRNRFQSGYCYETNVEMTLNWLKMIGDENRILLKNFYFYDANPRHDRNWVKDVKRLRRGPVVKEMGGVISSSYGEGCKHEVVFSRRVEDEELEALTLLFDG